MIKFFLEDSNYSMMRLLCFLAVSAGILAGAAVITAGFLKYDVACLRELTYLCAVFFGFGFGGKATQKYAETILQNRDKIKREEK
ncbi:MAG: hypothetical protein LWX07_06260 [Bacteroidetes bacterium]|nr:hypothetical protein [Bacteroidota bacterium]